MKDPKESLLEKTSGKPVLIECEKHDRYNRILEKVLADRTRDVFCMVIDYINKIDFGIERVRE